MPQPIVSAWNDTVRFLVEHWYEMLVLTGQHLQLVLASTGIAVLVGIPVGLLLTRRPRWQPPILGLANIMQTVPSLALFGFLIPLPLIGGIGARSAIVALVLYSLMPVIRNTVTGITGVDRNVREAAVAMGMTNGQVLWQVELPLAMSVILTGVRVAVVISVGVATIAAAIGAGGLGMYIFRGLRQDQNSLILAGAIPAALMALGADFGLGKLERVFDVTRRRTAPAGARSRTQRRLLLAAAGVVVVIACLAAFGLRNWKGSAYSSGLSTVERPRIVVGSKDFTESVLLGEILAQILEARGAAVDRQFELGGNLAHTSLVAGKIDCYPEYTGTAYTAILKHPALTEPARVYDDVKREYAERFGVVVGPPLGFSNDFAILVRGSDARRLNLRTISDAVPYSQKWVAGFGQDFVARADGYPGFTRAYNMTFSGPPREMDLSLTYRALAAGQVDLIAGNSTDGLISALDLFQLADDRHYFPPYQAVVLARADSIKRAPLLGEVIEQLRNRLSTEDMRGLNYELDGKKRDKAEVAREWIERAGLAKEPATARSNP